MSLPFGVIIMTKSVSGSLVEKAGRTSAVVPLAVFYEMCCCSTMEGVSAEDALNMSSAQVT